MRVFLEMEPGATGIPYHRPADYDRGKSYVNLKQHPEAIDELPEVKLDETLGVCLGFLNRPESVLESVGCETWDYFDSRCCDNAPFDKQSYIAVVFSEAPYGDNTDDWFWVFQRVSQMARELTGDKENNSVRVHMLLKPYVMYDKNRAGYQCEIWMSGKWNTKESCLEVYDGWLQAFAKQIDQAATEFVEKSKAERLETEERDERPSN